MKKDRSNSLNQMSETIKNQGKKIEALRIIALDLEVRLKQVESK